MEPCWFHFWENSLGGSGIYITSFNQTGLRINIFKTRIRDIANDCIFLDGAIHSKIVGNDIRTCNGNGISISNGSTVSIENNSVSGSGVDGILLVNTQGSIIRNNTVSNNSMSGIHIDSSESIMVYSNTVSQNTSMGGKLSSNSMANTIGWNTLMKNQVGLSIVGTVMMYNVFSFNRTSGNTTAMQFIPDLSNAGIDGGGNYCVEDVNGIPGACY